MTTTYNVYSYREMQNGEISFHLQLGSATKEDAYALYNKRVNGKYRQATWIVVPNTETGEAKLNAWLAKREELLAPKREAFARRYNLMREQTAKRKKFSGDIVKYFNGEYKVITY